MAGTGDSFGLGGTVCAVTGAGSGIGRGVAAALAAAGAKVAVLDRNEAAAKETVELIAKAGGEGMALLCDVADSSSVEAAATAVRNRFGDADVLVNNAAISKRASLLELSLADWNAVLSVNLNGYLICTQAFGKAMVARRSGVLVHIGSVTADMVLPFTNAYSIAKAGVKALSRLVAVEWGPLGVRSNVVHPGMIITPATEAAYKVPGASERRAKVVPSRRVGQPADIAGAVVYLASPLSAYANGAELTVDGGFTRNLMSTIPGYERDDI